MTPTNLRTFLERYAFTIACLFMCTGLSMILRPEVIPDPISNGWPAFFYYSSTWATGYFTARLSNPLFPAIRQPK